MDDAMLRIAGSRLPRLFEPRNDREACYTPRRFRRGSVTGERRLGKRLGNDSGYRYPGSSPERLLFHHALKYYMAACGRNEICHLALSILSVLLFDRLSLLLSKSFDSRRRQTPGVQAESGHSPICRLGKCHILLLLLSRKLGKIFSLFRSRSYFQYASLFRSKK